jgi:hypothetical protein
VNDLDTIARNAARGLREAVDRFDAVELPVAPAKPRRRLPVALGLAAGFLVAVLVVGLLVVAVSDGANGPARPGDGRWHRHSMRRAFGVSTFMRDVVGGPFGFVAAGAVPHGCPPGVAPWACQTSRLWSSRDGTRWTDVSLPALRGAQSDVTLGRMGDRAVAVWSSFDGGLAAWSSSDGRHWQRATVPPSAPASSQSESVIAATWDLGRWSGGLVASELRSGGLRSWTSRDGTTWKEVEDPAPLDRPDFLFPQGVPSRRGWVGLNGGVGALSNGASSGVPQIWRSDSGRGWAPISSDAPERLLPQLVPDGARRFVLAAQFRIPGVGPQPVGLYRTRDGRAWTEVSSFARAFPDANPFAVARAGRWWIVSGTSGPSPTQSTALWKSRDLVHWQQVLSPAGRFGAPGRLATRGTTAVAVPERGRWFRIADLGG